MWNYWIYGLFIFITKLLCNYVDTLDLSKLKYYELVEPYHVGVDGRRRNRRDLSTFTLEEKKHLDETVFIFSGYQRNFNLRIYKNNIFISDSFTHVYQKSDGSYQFETEVDNCYYQGYLSDRIKSSAAVTTCNGLKGVVRDEDEEEFVIEPHPNRENINDIGSSQYVLYNTKDVIATEEYKCGVNGTEGRNHHHGSSHKISLKNDSLAGYEEISYENDEDLNFRSPLILQTPEEHHRSRRSNTATKYIEIIPILDNRLYKKLYTDAGNNAKTALAKTRERGLEILNYVDLYYKTINTRVVVTNLFIFNEKDAFTITTSGSVTLDALQVYMSDVLFGEMKLKFDTAQLITKANWGGLAGLAGVGNMCTRTASAVTRDISASHVTANTLAHELGHNLGFPHYECTCTNGPCVMAHTAPGSACKGFAPCTKETYSNKLKTGDLSCLFNYPDVFFREPVCGNGLLETGEECDCGNEAECSSASTCCVWSTCKLKASAQCAQGECCQNCTFKSNDVVCRGKINDCDLEEYCTGKSAQCPGNYYIQDGTPCNKNTSYCYKGGCKTHDTGCVMLWGENAKKAADVCFNENLRRSDGFGSCGKNAEGNYIKCTSGNQLCGKMQCMAKSAGISLKFNIKGNAPRYKRIVTMGSIKCIQGKITPPADAKDPTIVGDGIKCGNNHICVSQKCVNLSSLTDIKRCDKPCLNGGVCNANGNCHCKVGFACPYCELKGMGGSIDSGAACVYDSDECDGCLSPLAKGLLILFLLVIPVLVIISLVLYWKRDWIRVKCGRQPVKVGAETTQSQVSPGVAVISGHP